MNIKAIASIAAIAAISLGTALPATAAEGTINGYKVNVLDSGSYDKADSITVWGPQGIETITVTCAPFDWKSHGANTAEFVDSIANAWCF